MKDTTSAGDALRALGGGLGRLYQPLQCPKRTIWLNRSASEAGPPHEGPVNIVLRHQLGDVGRGDRTAVLYPHPSRPGQRCSVAASQERTALHISCASAAVAVWPVPMAHMGS